MQKLRVTIVTLCALGALYGAALPASVRAAGIPAPDADCSQHGQLTRHYSAAQLRVALAKMPADIAEYTNCPDVIRRALVAQVGTSLKGGSGDSGGSFLPGWVIAVLIVVLLAAAGTGAVALRNRRRSE